MSYKTCPDCGERVYNLGCVNCNEPAYIEEQEMLTDLLYPLPSARIDTPTDQNQSASAIVSDVKRTEPDREGR